MLSLSQKRSDSEPLGIVVYCAFYGRRAMFGTIILYRGYSFQCVGLGRVLQIKYSELRPPYVFDVVLCFLVLLSVLSLVSGFTFFFSGCA